VIEALLAAALRGNPVRWPASWNGDMEERFIQAARAHGIQSLLAHLLYHRGEGQEWPDRVRTILAAETRAQVFSESLRFVELRRVLRALFEGGVHPLLLKGTHLAYTHYPSPCLRPCSDVDLLIRESDRQPAGRLMNDLGYCPGVRVSGELVTYQTLYQRDARLGLKYEFDIHWRLAEPQTFAQLASFDDLACEAVQVAYLGAGARGLSAVHALLLACVHRVAHHNNTRRLIWLYDIHLLAAGMSEQQWNRFMELAGQRRVRAICASGLRAAQRSCGAPVPSFVLSDLIAKTPFGEVERSAAFLKNGRRKADVFISDLRALPRWPDRLRLVYQHLFPSAEYVLRSNNTSIAVLLPLLYARRIVRGVGKWLRRRSPLDIF